VCAMDGFELCLDVIADKLSDDRGTLQQQVSYRMGTGGGGGSTIAAMESGCVGGSCEGGGMGGGQGRLSVLGVLIVPR
jgi:hypothetical protein